MNEGTTHWAGCWAAGPEHYECVLRERDKLLDLVWELSRLVKALEDKATGMVEKIADYKQAQGEARGD